MTEFIIIIVMLFFFVMFAASILGPIIMQIRQESADRAAKAAEHLITYTDSTSTATLLKRDSQISKVVKILKATNYTVAYEPETLHVGGVTVGGVTTGGVYKTGGYNYIAGSSDSGYCTLEYNGHMITRIKLSSEQFNQAKDSRISKYLNDKNRCIEVHTTADYTEAERDMILMNPNYLLSVKKGYPRRQKCEEILNWMCGNDD